MEILGQGDVQHPHPDGHAASDPQKNRVKAEQGHHENEDLQLQHEDASSVLAASASEQEAEAHQPYVRKEPKLGRNEPCWCGSGKKYKQCHGKLT